jgi:hypothetical protein
MKSRLLLFVSVMLLSGMNANAQLTDALFYGDIFFTKEVSTVVKKKEMTGIEMFSLEEGLFGRVFLKVRLKSHSAFQNQGDDLIVGLTITAETGEETTITLTFDTEQGEGKSASFEIIPESLDMKNENHLKLAGFFGKLPADVSSLIFRIGDQKGELLREDGYVVGRIDVDLINGLGKFQSLKDEQDRLEKIAEEERLVREAEEKRLAEERDALIKKTRDAYYNAKDVVKIAFKNTCNHEGTIRIATASEFTNQRASVSGQRQTDQYSCRPGDKVYNSDGKLLHTVSSSSDNKVISFCPPRTQAMIDEDNFQEGRNYVRITVINSCSDVKVHYNHQSGGSTSKTWMGSNSRTTIQMRKDDKLWIADENGNNVSVIFEPSSYSQDGRDVYLCR